MTTMTEEQANFNGAALAAKVEGTELVTDTKMAAVLDAKDPGARYEKWTMSEADVVEFTRDREPVIAQAIQNSKYLQAEVLAWRFKKLVVERDARITELEAELAARDDAGTDEPEDA